MAFTPDEVASQEFLSSMRGYDKEEVRRFLEAVAEQIAETEERIEALQEALHAERADDIPDADEMKKLVAELGRQLQLATTLVESLGGPGKPGSSISN